MSAESEAAPRVTLVGMPGCHLCDDAREVIRAVCDDLGVAWGERFIDEDPELYDLYREKIPVTLVDGQPFASWRVEAGPLTAVLTAHLR